MARGPARSPKKTATAPARSARGPGRSGGQPTKGGRYTPKAGSRPAAEAAPKGKAPGGEAPAKTKAAAAKGSKRGRPARPDPGIASGRYTPPVPRAKKSSPAWVPVLLFSFLVLGVAAIVANYLTLLPGGPSSWYLLGGLGLILAGFVTATQYR